MTEPDEVEPIAELGWEKEKAILSLLAKGRQVKLIAQQYQTYEKAIHRVRDKALRYPSTVKAMLPKEVQEYLESWALKHNRKLADESQRDIHYKEEMERHKEDLCKSARAVLRKLHTYILWDDNMLIGEVSVENDDLETIGFYQDQIIIGLFTHLQYDIPELKPFARWEELRLKDITLKLKKQISMKVARRDFSGECEICKNWD